DAGLWRDVGELQASRPWPTNRKSSTRHHDLSTLSCERIQRSKINIGPNVPPDTSLNSFIRNYANLRGTKAMCHEGGCGSCIVAVTSQHPVKEQALTYAVNSVSR
ncbi:hypothetical protein L9F63_025311, partial [Diploptera punctata]